jgi:hypothetical protein
MTNVRVVSVEIPVRILKQLPPAGGGRGSFILRAIEEKIARRKAALRKPRLERRRRLAALLKTERAERDPLVAAAPAAQELKARRGRSS